MNSKPLPEPSRPAPKLLACMNCPANFVCCSVSTRGGVVESPYLMPTDITAISKMTGLKKEEFSEDRLNPLTGNVVSFISPANNEGCRFHDPIGRKCGIYDARPIDCRLYPLDILFKEGRYYWILWQYCEITNEDLEALVAYGQALIPSIKDHLHDYATVPLEAMDQAPFLIITPVQFD
jgi:Fe-S-cluster containining protein